MRVKLSVVVPCYNEEARFSEGFNHYYSFLNKQNYAWELIFVNDGSKDDTEKLIDRQAFKNSKIKKLSYKKNKGKGYAVAYGVKRAVGKIILFSDLDHSVDISTINNLLPYFEKGYEVVIGSRRVEGSKLIKRQPLIREFLGRCFTMLVRVTIDWKIKDSTCGFKAFKSRAAKKIFSKVKVFGWVFDAEILFLCKKYDIKYAQAPVSWKDVRGSKVSLTKDVIGSLRGLIKIRLNDVQNKY